MAEDPPPPAETSTATPSGTEAPHRPHALVPTDRAAPETQTSDRCACPCHAWFRYSGPACHPHHACPKEKSPFLSRGGWWPFLPFGSVFSNDDSLAPKPDPISPYQELFRSALGELLESLLQSSPPRPLPSRARLGALLLQPLLPLPASASPFSRGSPPLVSWDPILLWVQWLDNPHPRRWEGSGLHASSCSLDHSTQLTRRCWSGPTKALSVALLLSPTRFCSLDFVS